jgi:hypothetical protein
MRTRTISMLFMTMLLTFGTMHYSDAYSATVTLGAEEEADLLFMREEEKLARDVYLTFYELYEGLTVFSNIASSEQSHMDALLRLLKKYKLDDPAAGNAIGEFDDDILQALYYTLIAQGQEGEDDEEKMLNALKVGGLIEEKDMLDIQAAINVSQQDQIDAVYATLLCGSRNHLRSFAQNIETLSGMAYEALLLDQKEVDAILESPMEKCGKKGIPDRNACKGKCLGWMK